MEVKKVILFRLSIRELGLSLRLDRKFGFQSQMIAGEILDLSQDTYSALRSLHLFTTLSDGDRNDFLRIGNEEPSLVSL